MKKAFYILAALVIGAIATALFLYNRETQDAMSTKAAIVISSEQLFRDFSNDESKSNKLYLGKVIEVTGKVTEVNDFEGNYSILLSTNDPLFGINCSFSNPGDLKKVKKGEHVKVKGLCTGMLTDVVLIKCSIEM